jgi:predicted deacylase
MPVANLPALEPRSEYICPVDGKNINFSFPGSPDGSFSEALADALLTEWAHDADCLIDLHGGDLRENVAQFNVVPLTGDSAFDDVNISLAKAFDPQIIVTIEAARLGEPGRSCSARAQRKQYSAFAEAGANGLPDESSIEFHKNGVLRVAHYFEMIDQIATEGVRQTSVGDLYVWQSACSSGWCTYLIEPGESVLEGQMVATIRSMSGDAEQPVYADATGSILWRNTHPIITKDLPLFGIAFSSLPKQITEKRP